MTISEQIREAALYAEKPYLEASLEAFDVCLAQTPFGQFFFTLEDTDLRTFMLLVAEALE